MTGRLTNTEHDEAIAAGWDAYPDPPPIERYELAGEREWLRGLEKRVAAGEIDPHDWPREAETPLLDGLHRAIEAAREARREGDR